MGAGTMPRGGMSPMGMELGGAMGFDPEMTVMLARRLQELQNQLTQLNAEISAIGGETSPAARPLLVQRAMCQGQIRDLELQINLAGATSPTMPGMPAGGNPMGAMPPGMPGMPGYGTAAPSAADMITRDPAMQGMPGVAGYRMQGLPGAAGYDAMQGMGAAPNRMMLEQLRQDAITELQYVQRTLSFIDANDPVRATIEARQSELLAQLESLNNQFGQNPTQPMTVPGVAGSTTPTLTDRVAQPARISATTNPRIVQMQNAERQLRAMGNTALADDLQRQIEQELTQGFVEPQVPAAGMTMPMPPIPAAVPPTAAMSVPPALSQQGELVELRNTVDSLRGEIAAMREEMRALQTLLRQYNEKPLVPPATDGANGLSPASTTYTVP